MLSNLVSCGLLKTRFIGDFPIRMHSLHASCMAKYENSNKSSYYYPAARNGQLVCRFVDKDDAN